MDEFTLGSFRMNDENEDSDYTSEVYKLATKILREAEEGISPESYSILKAFVIRFAGGELMNTIHACVSKTKRGYFYIE